MPNLSLPFVVSMLLVVLAVRLAAGTQGAMGWRFAVFFIACAVLAGLIGLRWGVDPGWARHGLPVMGAALPAVAWLCFGLPATGRARLVSRDAWHSLPMLAIFALDLIYWPAVDLALAVIDLGYAAALLRLAKGGPDALATTAFGALRAVRVGLLVGAVTLLISALVDVAISLARAFGDGGHTALIVGLAQGLALIAVAGAVIWFRPGTEAASEPTQIAAAPIDAAADAAIVATIDELMRGTKLYRDPALTLDRLARRAGLPARQVSTALNRVRGRNVSQLVNEYRIAAAQQMLRETALPVTEIMMDCGFLTKSNFNREFRRIAGASPTDWRRGAVSAAGMPPETG